MIRLSLLVILGTAAATAAAQVPAPRWIVYGETGCGVRSDRPQPQLTFTWSGACDGGLAQGRGVLQWFRDGKPTDRYDGDMRDGQRDGRGVYSLTNGERYDGEFRDGREDGRGVLTRADGSRYDGAWHDGKPNGRGVSTFARGGGYDGDIRDGRPDGRGILTLANGDRYDGAFRDGKPNGQGTYTKADGGVYSGLWTNGCFRQGGRSAEVDTTAAACGGTAPSRN